MIPRIGFDPSQPPQTPQSEAGSSSSSSSSSSALVPRARTHFQVLSMLEGPDSPRGSGTSLSGLPLQDGSQRTQDAAFQSLFSANLDSSGSSSALTARFQRIMNEESPLKRPRIASSSSSSSSSTNLSPPRLGRGLSTHGMPFRAPMPILPDLAGFVSRPTRGLESLRRPFEQPVPETPKTIHPVIEAQNAATPCIRALNELREKISKSKSFPLQTSNGEVIFTIQEKVDPSMGQHADVYIGHFVGKDQKRVHSVLKLPKKKQYVSSGRMLDRIANQLILQARSEADETLKKHVPKYYNFDHHLKALNGCRDPEKVRNYVAEQRDLGYQLAEYIPDKFPAPIDGSPVDFKDPRWEQFQKIVSCCVANDYPHDLLPSNVRVRLERTEEGKEVWTVYIIDTYEEDGVGLTCCRLRGHFKTEWGFSDSDLEKMLALLEEPSSNKVPVHPKRAQSFLTSLSLIDSDDEKE